jgi:nanoRNase/pAp phosphatase (c-di-AMP/oligoRNAs hydrolase)
MEIDKDTIPIPQIMIKDTMEPNQEDKEFNAILQYVAKENKWGNVVSSTVASTTIRQDGSTIYTTLYFECELEESSINEITLTTKGYIKNKNNLL